MQKILEIAGGCVKGRRVNSDNFLMDGRCLPLDNRGTKRAVAVSLPLNKPACLGIFTGTDPEGSFAAARTLKEAAQALEEYIIPEKAFLRGACERMNSAVYSLSAQGRAAAVSTAMALFSQNQVYICNLGTSRAYRMRCDMFMQLSRDHGSPFSSDSSWESPAQASPAPHLGITPEKPDAYIAKGDLRQGDWYILCSESLTMVLSNFDISHIVHNAPDPAGCVDTLIRAAREHGSEENVTILVCRIAQ